MTVRLKRTIAVACLAMGVAGFCVYRLHERVAQGHVVSHLVDALECRTHHVVAVVDHNFQAGSAIDQGDAGIPILSASDDRAIESIRCPDGSAPARDGATLSYYNYGRKP